MVWTLPTSASSLMCFWIPLSDWLSLILVPLLIPHPCHHLFLHEGYSDWKGYAHRESVLLNLINILFGALLVSISSQVMTYLSYSFILGKLASLFHSMTFKLFRLYFDTNIKPKQKKLKLGSVSQQSDLSMILKRTECGQPWLDLVCDTGIPYTCNTWVVSVLARFSSG